MIEVLPPWTQVAIDLLADRVAEVPGPVTHPEIAEMWQLLGLMEGDETAWCSACQALCMDRAGFPHTGMPNARSWSTYGQELSGFAFGAIVVLWRESPDSWKGHVCQLLDWNGAYSDPTTLLTVVGGNQGNRVSIARYQRNRLLTLRWPAGLVRPTTYQNVKDPT